MNYDYVVADPTGNITVLVKTPVPAKLQPAVAAEIMEQEKGVEQVGFIYDAEDADIGLRMAGGEFCGNATLSAGALFACNRGEASCEIAVRVSGAELPLKVQAEKTCAREYSCSVLLPKPLSIKEQNFNLDGVDCRLPVVDMGGIKHIIVTDTYEGIDFGKAAVSLCSELGAKALGIMQLDRDAMTLRPLVYVPESGTLFYENSCASGSCAAAAYLSQIEEKCGEYAFRQPGGTLRVDVRKDGPVLKGNVRLR